MRSWPKGSGCFGSPLPTAGPGKASAGLGAGQNFPSCESAFLGTGEDLEGLLGLLKTTSTTGRQLPGQRIPPGPSRTSRVQLRQMRKRHRVCSNPGAQSPGPAPNPCHEGMEGPPWPAAAGAQTALSRHSTRPVGSASAWPPGRRAMTSWLLGAPSERGSLLCSHRRQRLGLQAGCMG